MSKTVKEMLKDLPEVKANQLPSLEDKKEFIDEQIAQLKKVIYRHQVDLEVGKHFYEVGVDKEHEDFAHTGRENIAAAVGNLRGAVPQLERLEAIREELGN